MIRRFLALYRRRGRVYRAQQHPGEGAAQMTIYAEPSPPFDCAICKRPQMQGDQPWQRVQRADNSIAPLCLNCENIWGKRVVGFRDMNRDRRLARQISALTEIIMATAHCKQNGHREPYE